MEDFKTLLERAAATHGHLCAGQVLGIRMALAGCREVGIQDPRGADRKKLYVVVEIDRCATDAIATVTGCTLGKRTLRWVDYGVMAATFLNLETGKAVRVVAREEARALADARVPPDGKRDRYARQLEAYQVMPEEELFTFQEVALTVPPEDLPGRPLRRVQCQACGEWVQDGRDVVRDSRTLCRGCAHGRYYRVLEKR